MTPEQWARVNDLYHAALALREDERDAFLERNCAATPEIAAEVRSLLQLSVEDDFIAHPDPAAVSELIAAHDALALIGTRLGAYRVTDRIGTGGMGEVYAAQRVEGGFSQRVAIKLIRRGLETESLLRRFHRERETLARLEHPNIARLLDGGVAHDDRPYLVMEHVDGAPITEYCRERALEIGERLELFRTICAAVQYAHRNLVLHCDIKPGNILVTPAGAPKLLDFGIARMLSADDDRLPKTATALHRFVTPEYTSPEQIRGDALTTTSDVYSLGVVLFELLVGQKPFEFKSRSLTEIERMICETEPSKPSTVLRQTMLQTSRAGPNGSRPPKRIAGDLDNIVLMALRKEPTQRYASVEQLAEDVRRFQRGLPVVARKGTWSYRAAKFFRRNHVSVAAAAVVVLALTGGIAGVSWQARIADQRRNEAIAARQDAVLAQQRSERINEFLQGMLAAVAPGNEGRDVTVLQTLDAAAERLETELRDEPEVRADLHTTIGNTYAALGRYAEAETHLSEALTIRQSVLGPRNASVVESLSALAVVKYSQADFPAAEEFARRALQMRRSLQLGDPEALAQTLNNLGAILRARGELDAAEPLYREALSTRRRLLGDQAPAVAESLNNLAGLYMARKDYAGAEPLLREALEIREAAFKPDHPLVAQSISNLATLLAKMDRGAEAEPLQRRALALHRRSLGDDHQSVARDLSNLGHICLQNGKPAEAETVFREASAIWEHIRPAGHWQIAYERYAISLALIAQERYDPAEKILLEAYQTLRDAQGAPRVYSRRILTELVKLYRAWDKPEQAAAFRELLDKAQRSPADSSGFRIRHSGPRRLKLESGPAIRR